MAASKADSEKLVAPEPTTTMSVWIWVAIVGDEEEAKQKQKKTLACGVYNLSASIPTDASLYISTVQHNACVRGHMQC